MKTGTLDLWAVVSASSDPYRAPEQAGIAISGILRDASPHDDREGRRVWTSRVVSVNGRVVTTRSGSVYHLGSIHPEYREWIRKNRPEWDWRNPIKDIAPRKVA